MPTLPPLDAVIHDVLAFAERGAGFWRVQDLRLPALEEVARLAGILGRTDDPNDRFDAVESVLVGAVSALPKPWQDVAVDHLGFSEQARSLSSQTARENLAARHIFMDGRTYRRLVVRDDLYPSWKLKTITLVARASVKETGRLAGAILDDEAGGAAVSTAGRGIEPRREVHAAGGRPQSEISDDRRVSIFCAVPVEHAIIRRFCRTLAWNAALGFERGTITAGETEWDVSVYCTGQTNSAAAAATATVLSIFRPALAIFVGMAGGFAEKDIRHLDLVVASAVHLYQSGAAHEERLRSRPRSRNSDQTLLDLVGVVAQDHTLGPEAIHLGDIVSGDQLLKSLASDTYQLIRQHYDQALAVDMEGYGFLEAASRLRVPSLLVRGISDLLEDKRPGTDASRQPAATDRAMRLAVKILEHYEPRPTTAEADAAQPQPAVPSARTIDTEEVQLAAMLLPNAGGVEAFNEPGFAPLREMALRVVAGEWASLGATSLNFVENRLVRATFPQTRSAVEGTIASLGAVSAAQWPHHATAELAFGLASSVDAAVRIAPFGGPNRIVAEARFRRVLTLLGLDDVRDESRGYVSVAVPVAAAAGPLRGVATGVVLPRENDLLAEEEEIVASDGNLLAHDFWNLASHMTTLIIVAPDTRRQEAVSRHSDYSELNFVGDKDAVLRACVHLARLFPQIDIVVYPASWLPDSSRTSPLLVAGGPLGAEGRGGNKLAAEIVEYYSLPISYDLEREPPCLTWDGTDYSTEYDRFGQISQDGAFTARLPNPWNPEVDVVLVQGTHTYGGLGALKAFTDRSAAAHNVDVVRTSAGRDLHFAAVFCAKVAGGVLLPPRLHATNVFPFTFGTS